MFGIGMRIAFAVGLAGTVGVFLWTVFTAFHLLLKAIELGFGG